MAISHGPRKTGKRGGAERGGGYGPQPHFDDGGKIDDRRVKDGPKDPSRRRFFGVAAGAAVVIAAAAIGARELLTDDGGNNPGTKRPDGGSGGDKDPVVIKPGQSPVEMVNSNPALVDVLSTILATTPEALKTQTPQDGSVALWQPGGVVQQRNPDGEQKAMWVSSDSTRAALITAKAVPQGGSFDRMDKQVEFSKSSDSGIKTTRLWNQGLANGDRRAAYQVSFNGTPGPVTLLDLAGGVETQLLLNVGEPGNGDTPHAFPPGSVAQASGLSSAMLAEAFKPAA